MAQNDQTLLLEGILDELAAPRETDEPGEYESRQRLRDQVDPLLEPLDCPPGPNGNN